MKLRNITNVEKFLETVDQCKGDVYLTTPQGDRLNLKSQLTKMLAMTSVFDSAEIKEMDLEFSNPEDVSTMLLFSMEAACSLRLAAFFQRQPMYTAVFFFLSLSIFLQHAS